MKRFALIVLSVTLVATGCSTTTKTSRQEAAGLSIRVQSYRQDQQKRIETLNRDYQKTFTRLMGELDRLYEFQVDQSLDLGAMKVAEDLLTKWEDATLPKQFRDTFTQALDDNMAKVQVADISLQQARTTYAARYKDAVLQLKKLDDVKSSLDTLSAKPSDTKQLTELLRTIYVVYQNSQKGTTAATKGNQ